MGSAVCDRGRQGHTYRVEAKGVGQSVVGVDRVTLTGLNPNESVTEVDRVTLTGLNPNG